MDLSHDDGIFDEGYPARRSSDAVAERSGKLEDARRRSFGKLANHRAPSATVPSLPLLTTPTNYVRSC